MKKIAVLLIAFTLIFISCNDEKKVIKIGVILPLSGEVATYGLSVRKGIEIAIKNDKDYNISFQDSKAENKTAMFALEKLFFDDIKIFIGDATSNVTNVIGPRIQSKNGLLIVPIATSDKIRNIGENVFMISPRNEKQTNKIIEFVKNTFTNKNIGCLFKQNDYSVNITNRFLKSFPNAYSQAYQDGQNDFHSILNKFKKEKIDVVFVPGNYIETASILRQSREIGLEATFVGTDGCYSPELIKLAGIYSENFLLTMMPIDYHSKMYLEFERKFFIEQKNEKVTPDIFACYGYESVKILIEAINNSPNKTVSEIKKYLKTHTFNSLTGNLKFDSKGEAEREYQIYYVKNGQFKPYK